MSRLQKEVFLRKITEKEKGLAMGSLGLSPFDEEEEEEEEDHVGELGISNEPVFKKPNLFTNNNPRTTSSKYSPTPWNTYFDEQLTVSIHRTSLKQDTPRKQRIDFNVYVSLPSSTVPDPTKPLCVYAFHHGAGSSGLSFACAAKALQDVFQSDGHNGSESQSQSQSQFNPVTVAPNPHEPHDQDGPVNKSAAFGKPGFLNHPTLPSMPMPGMIPLPGSGMPATVFPGAELPFALTHEPLTASASPTPSPPDPPALAAVISYDIRYHGKTKVYNLNEKDEEYEEEPVQDMDMSLETLALDYVQVVNRVCEIKGWASSGGQGENQQTGADRPCLVLVGHSLGGSVVTCTAPCIAASGAEGVEGAEGADTANRSDPSLPLFSLPVTGLAVLDVVEGTATESLSSMPTLLASLPKSFASLEKAIEWHVRSKTLRSLESAKVSVPGVVKEQPAKSLGSSTACPEERSSTKGTLVAGGRYDWTINLSLTSPFWPSWFSGLSSRFLAYPSARLLILAGTDRLDKPLLLGQMQGKYQLAVVSEAGHFVQEDCAGKCASLLWEFWKRNEMAKKIVPVFGKFGKSN